MKRILLIISAVLIGILLITPLEGIAQDATPLLWRSAKTLPQGGILIWDSLFYADLTEKYDWNKKDLKLSCNLRGTKTYKKEDADGNKIENTRKNRLYVIPMVIWSPVKGLKIKPKLKVPIRSACKGGNLFDVQYILECWYCF